MKVIVIYGTECDENTAWLPWLKKKLFDNNISCEVPHFPTPKNQSFENWSKVLNSYEIKSDDILVGWSTGAIFAVRYLFENNLNIKKLLLISGFNNYLNKTYPTIDSINKDFFMKDESVAKNVAKSIVCFKSNNDPFISQTALNTFAKNLGAKLITIENGGHFNAAAGYTSFFKLYDEIKK